MGLEIFNFCYFYGTGKLYNKTNNKTQTTKHQENSALRFGVNYLADHLSNFLQDTIKH